MYVKMYLLVKKWFNLSPSGQKSRAKITATIGTLVVSLHIKDKNSEGMENELSLSHRYRASRSGLWTYWWAVDGSLHYYCTKYGLQRNWRGCRDVGEGGEEGLQGCRGGKCIGALAMYR
ncbi:parkin coregulated-like protein [Platysternon megacephalum]|uniref:Parkin coregulated-like protein n=1 Tax=Platysternon megacephalum TaxID=55544 RepID=A0A4D9ELH0_9SAUR|nr:parkin coregulated-like protein [Platysternon megacephalum]